MLDDFADHLRLEMGRSEHTVRAYVGGARALLSFAGARGVAASDIDLALLRSWLAELTRRGAARTTICLLYTSPSPRDATLSRMPSSA